MFNLFKKKTITHEQIREYPVNNGLFSNSILIFQSYDTLNRQFIQVLYVLYKYYNAIGLPEMATRVLQQAEPLVEEDFNDDQFNTFILPFRLELIEKLFEIYIQWEQQSIITTQEISDIAGLEINPAFHRFLYESPVATNFAAVLEDINKNLFDTDVFKYNNFCLVSQNVPIIYNSERKEFTIENGHDNSLDTNNGTCAALSEKAYQLIRAKYPWINMIMAGGFETGFQNYTHCFLVFFEDDEVEFLINGIRASTNEDITPFIAESRFETRSLPAGDGEERFIFVDPTYGTIGRDTSQYTMVALYGTNCLQDKRNLIIPSDSTLPVQITKTGEVYEVYFDTNIGVVGASIRSANNSRKFFNLADPEFIAMLKNSPELQQFYTDLQSKTQK